MEIITTYVLPLFALSGFASLLAALLPRPAEGSSLGVIFHLIDALAMNWLNARNAKPN